jgi:acetyltransferase-like isoleucine patch superfamily enzyme
LNTHLNSKTIFEGYNKLWAGVSISGSIIGRGTYIGRDSLLDNSMIGRFCSIASNVKIIAATHPTETFVSTHPSFYSLKKQAGFTFVNNQLYNEFKLVDNFYVVIGNDVWIGSDVILIGGIRIGDGAIILAGSVVAKDVDPYSIVGGISAKHIRYRFNANIVDRLMNIKWWNWDLEKIKKRKETLTDINIFISNNADYD